jgi:peptidoglycan/LPS O-acetylase OafA/YrhL
VLATLLCLAVAQGLHTYLVLSESPAPIDPQAHRSALNLLIGMSAGLCALEMMPRVSVLERIGASSYPIYLYHSLFIATVLVLAVARPAVPASLLFLAAGAAGVAGPMLMERVARHVPAGPFLLTAQVNGDRGGQRRRRTTGGVGRGVETPEAGEVRPAA